MLRLMQGQNALCFQLCSQVHNFKLYRLFFLKLLYDLAAIEAEKKIKHTLASNINTMIENKILL